MIVATATFVISNLTRLTAGWRLREIEIQVLCKAAISQLKKKTSRPRVGN